MRWRRHPRCPDSHRDFGPLAEQLARRAAEEAAQDAEGPAKLLDAVTGRLENAAEEVYRARVAELLSKVFAKLSPQVQWQLLAEYFDDDTIRNALARQHDEALARIDPSTRLQLLIQQARESGHLDVSDVPDGTTLTILLYEQGELFGTSPNLPPPEQAARTIFLKWNSSESMWCVLYETHNTRFSDTRYDLEPRDFIEIGTWYKTDETLDVNNLYWGSVLKFLWNGQFHTLKMRINDNYYQMFLGQCVLNGTQVWLEHPPGFSLPQS